MSKKPHSRKKSNGEQEQSVKSDAAPIASLPSDKNNEASPAAQRLLLVVCIAGIMTSYIIYGLVQEQFGSKLFKKDENSEGRKFKFVSFTLGVQAVVNCALAGFVMLIRFRKSASILSTPGKVCGLYGLTSAVQMAAMFCSNRAVYFVDYPTHVVAKCCKPIPVLLFGLLFGRGLKNYPLSRIISVSITTAGVALFMRSSAMNKNKNGTSLDGEERTFGFLLLGASLLFDGLTGFFQDMVMQNHCKKDADKAARAPWEMMFFLNAFGALFMLIITLFTGEGIQAVQFCMEFPEALWMVLVSAFVSAIGQSFVYITIAHFDALMCSTVTTIRKFCSILLSVIWFKHPLSSTQWTSVVFVFGGIGFELFQKGKNSSSKSLPDYGLFLPVKKIVNARDLGGYVMKDGQQIKTGRLLRTAALCSATEEDVHYLESIPVSCVFDFRTEFEKRGKQDKEIKGAENIALPISAAKLSEDEIPGFVKGSFDISKFIMFAAFHPRGKATANEMYSNITLWEENQKQYAAFFRRIVETPNGAILFHCTQGKDRAGMAAAFLLAALGADRETIVRDFDLTNAVYADDLNKFLRRVKLVGGKEDELNVVRSFIGANTENFKKALDAIEERYGSLDGYLHGPLGLTDDDIQTLRDRYLTPAQQSKEEKEE